MTGDRLPPLAAAFLRGEATELLDPIRVLAPGELPTGAPPIPLGDRAALAEGLRVPNASYGHPRVDERVDQLIDPSTRVVVTGQQPGLYGGPLMALTKAMAAVRYAEALTARGEPTVPVFWVATEDHDFAEVARTTLLGKDGPERLTLGEDPSPLLPVGMRTFGEPYTALAERASELLGGRGADERFEQVGAWFRPDTRFGEAFARLLIAVMGERAPLVLDSMLPAVKRVQAPFLRRLVEERATLDEALAAQHERVEGAGYPLQVNPQPGVSPLFLLHSGPDGGQRRRIEWRGADRFGLRGLDEFEAPVEQLLQTIDDNPAVVSPGVLARPAIQDAILGTTLQVLGPSETSYMAQAAAVHRLLGIEGVWTTLRPQIAVLEAKPIGWMRELGLGLDELMSTQPLEELLAARVGSDPTLEARRSIENAMDALRQPVLDIDGSLENPWRKTRDQMGRALDQLSSKVAGAIARRHEVWLRRLEQLRHQLSPDGNRQERELSTLHFWARHGDELAEAIHDQLDLDPRFVQLIEIS